MDKDQEMNPAENQQPGEAGAINSKNEGSELNQPESNAYNKSQLDQTEQLNGMGNDQPTEPKLDADTNPDKTEEVSAIPQSSSGQESYPSTPKPFPEPDYPLSDSGNGSPLLGSENTSTKKQKKTRVKKPRKPLSPVAKAAAIAAVVSLILGGSAGALTAKLTSNNNSSSPVQTPSFSKNSSVIASPTDIQAILSKVEPAVVDIQTSGTVNQGGFFGGTSTFQAAGTGMIISSNGEVLTNNHVIANATTIKVQLFNQTKLYNAVVVGTDPAHDVAVIKIEGVSKLPTVSFGKSSALQVGDSVVAVGNALALQGLPTVTQGIVSALHRSITTSPNGVTSSTTLTDMIQTDAPINPGNSGGPLVDSNGQVIGMNTAIISGTGSEPAQNIGFAEAIDSVLPIVHQIESHPNTNKGPITSGKAFLGVGVETLTPQIANQIGLPSNLKGVVVAQVVPGSPANNAGITAGSVITKVDSTKVTTATQLVKIIQQKSPGSSVTIYWTTSNGSGSAVVILGSAPTA